MKATIGIDLGTSAVKVLALSVKGRKVLAEASRSYPTLTPRPGFAEQSPEVWWTATCAAIGEVLEKVPGDDIAAIGFSGQVNGMVLLDVDGEVIGNAIIWLDARAAAEARELETDVSDIVARTASRVSAITVLAKLKWLGRHDPDRLSRARSLLFAKDYLMWRMTGVKCTDASEATSASMLDIARGDWFLPGVEATGAESSILPPLHSATGFAGRVSTRASAETGLPSGIPVVPGAGDVAALATGCGVISPGILGVTLGTAGHVVLSVDADALFTPGAGLWRVAHAAPDKAVWLGLVMSGGLSLSWLHRIFSTAGPGTSFDDLVGLADASAAGANGVSFVPFLEGAATPYDRMAARGSFVGLSSSTGAGDMVEAVLEGVGFNIRQCVDAFGDCGTGITEIRLAEGGARVDRWCQVLAGILDRPITRLEHLNTSSLGAALMANCALSGTSLSDLAGVPAGGSRTFQPQRDQREAYENAYRRYLAAADQEISRVAGVSPEEA